MSSTSLHNVKCQLLIVESGFQSFLMVQLWATVIQRILPPWWCGFYILATWWFIGQAVTLTLVAEQINLKNLLNLCSVVCGSNIWVNVDAPPDVMALPKDVETSYEIWYLFSQLWSALLSLSIKSTIPRTVHVGSPEQSGLKLSNTGVGQAWWPLVWLSRESWS